jgi:hypothetical protein
MTEYTATCAIDEDDTVTALRSDSRVELEPSSRASVFLDPGPARTFARGILALADEIDGGEAPAARPIQVGDTVRVVTDDSHLRTGEFVGRTGKVVQVGNRFSSRLKYRLEFPGEKFWWVEKVELVDEAPGTDRPTKVGDRVEIVRAERWSSAEEGRVGVVGMVDEDDDHLPYRVVDEHDGAFIAWCTEVRRLDEPAEATAPEPTSSPFARYVDEAKGLLEGTPHTATDVITLARELRDAE